MRKSRRRRLVVKDDKIIHPHFQKQQAKAKRKRTARAKRKTQRASRRRNRT
jgi:hypothetical protein